MSRLLSLMICCCLGTALPASAFTYYSEQNMPFNGQDEQGNSTGLAVELLRLMWQEMGEPEQPIAGLSPAVDDDADDVSDGGELEGFELEAQHIADRIAALMESGARIFDKEIAGALTQEPR